MVACGQHGTEGGVRPKEATAVEEGSAFIQEMEVEPTGSGPLDGLTFAVKDLIDIGGYKTGCGYFAQLRKALSYPAPCVGPLVRVSMLFPLGAWCGPTRRRLSGKEMKELAEDDFTNEVLATFEDAESERFKEIMQSLIRHLHTFVREVQLTEEEWFEAIRFLTRVGRISDDNRQEFILLSDTLGVSMQMIGVNHSKPSGATESTVVGPFYVEGAPECKNGDDLANGAPGEPCFVEGQVRSVSGGPIANAHLEVWQADDEGFYDVQREGLSEVQNRGQFAADENGRFWFWTVKPASYPIPHDGPVGEMLKAAKRTPWRPAHIHFKVWAPGYETVITHVFEKGDKYLGSDAVFGVKDSLIADFVRHQPETAPDGTEMDKPFYTLNYDFVLAPRA